MKKGQMNIDYIISLGIFIVVILGAASFYNSNLGKFMSNINDLGSRMSGLYITYRAYSLMITNQTLNVNKTFVSLLKDCSSNPSITNRINDYEKVRKLLLLSPHQEVFLKGDLYIVGYVNDWNYISPQGVFYVDNKPYVFTLKKNKQNFFNEMIFEGKTYKIGDFVEINGKAYYLDDIDPYGYFILLKRKVFFCGARPNPEASYTTHYFYVNYNNNILEVTLYAQG